MNLYELWIIHERSQGLHERWVSVWLWDYYQKGNDIFQLKTQYSAEASYYVLHLNWKVSTYSMKQVYKSRSQPTLFQQTLSAVPLSLGEPDKLDLCYLRVSHSASHRSDEIGVCTCVYFCSQVLEICCSEDVRLLLGDRQAMNMSTSAICLLQKCEFLSYLFYLLILISIQGFM